MSEPINVLTPEVEIIKLGDNNKFPNIYKLIEYVGRTCYQTRDKIDDTSWQPFIKKAAKDEHRSLFEFNNLQISMVVERNILVDDLLINPYLYTRFNYFGNKINPQVRLTIQGSIRAFLELLESYAFGIINKIDYELLCNIFNVLSKKYDDIVFNWSTNEYLYDFYNKCYNCNIELKDITPHINSQNPHSKILVRVITTRGLHNEFVRHRMTQQKGGVSYMAESQRYVRYGVKKPFSIVVPSKYIHDDTYVGTLTHSATEAFREYKTLLKFGYSPSLACSILPRCTAIEYFIYTTIEEWRHIFKLRTSKHAHIEFQEVAKNIRDEMINKGVFM